jgi:hypothetical protein
VVQGGMGALFGLRVTPMMDRRKTCAAISVRS